jgi:hypothetical protein
MDSFGRVKIKFNHGAILNFGGLILQPENNLDPEWLSYISPKAKEAELLLLDALDLCQKLILDSNLKAKARIIKDFDLPFYLVIKTERGHLE